MTKTQKPATAEVGLSGDRCITEEEYKVIKPIIQERIRALTAALTVGGIDHFYILSRPVMQKYTVTAICIGMIAGALLSFAIIGTVLVEW